MLVKIQEHDGIECITTHILVDQARRNGGLSPQGLSDRSLDRMSIVSAPGRMKANRAPVPGKAESITNVVTDRAAVVISQPPCSDIEHP